MFIGEYYTQFVQTRLYKHEFVTVGLYNRVKWRVIVSYKGLKKSGLYTVFFLNGTQANILKRKITKQGKPTQLNQLHRHAGPNT